MQEFKKTQGADINDDVEQKRILQLAEKYANKPYHVRWLVLYYITKAFSFLFNIGSAIGAFALGYYFTFRLTNEHVSACIFGSVSVAMWEVLKRYTIGEMYKDYFADNRLDYKLVTFVILIVGGSISASYFGAKSAIPDIMEGPQLESYESKTLALRTSLAEQKKRLADFNKDKSNYNAQGEMYYDLARKTRPEMVRKISDLELKLASAEQKTNQTNETKGIAHAVYVSDNASHYALAVALFDILLLLCFFFTENYDYKEAYFRGLTPTQLKAKYEESKIVPVPPTVPKRSANRSGTDKRTEHLAERNTYKNGTLSGTEHLAPHIYRDFSENSSKNTYEIGFNKRPKRSPRICSNPNCTTDISARRANATTCSAKCRKEIHKQNKT